MLDLSAAFDTVDNELGDFHGLGQPIGRVGLGWVEIFFIFGGFGWVMTANRQKAPKLKILHSVNSSTLIFMGSVGLW